MFAKGGELYFESTGDPLLDKWEEELAKGAVPDLEEGLSSTEREKLKKERAKARAQRAAAQALGTVSDDYVNDPKYASKRVAVGSPDEHALLARKLLGQTGKDAQPRFLGEDTSAPADAWEDMLGST